jgi:hypothetical protein
MVENALHYILSKSIDTNLPASKGQKNHQSMQRSQKVKRSRSQNYRANDEEDLEQAAPRSASEVNKPIIQKEQNDPNYKFYISVLTVNIPQTDIRWCDW